MLDVAGGDTGMSRHLAKALNILGGSPGADGDLKAQIDDILRGKSTIRDLVTNETFARLSDAAMPKALADFEAASPEDIRRKAELGEAILESYRHQEPETPPAAEPVRSAPPADIRARSADHVIPGTRKPDRNRIVGPDDDPDEDDRYYQDRNRRGWLD